MILINNKMQGDRGELEVIKLVPCPNCGRKLALLPNSYPLYDVQCSGCSFRAQVKTNQTSPKSIVFGAGWEIVDKVLKAGFLMPPLILNFKWIINSRRRQEIRFYPFVPRKNLKKRFTKIKKSGREIWMFNYIDMNNIEKMPYFVLYSK